MQTGIAASEILYFGLLDRLYHALGDEFHLVVDAGKIFGDIEQQGGTTAKQRTRLRRDDGAVGQFDGGRGVPTAGLALIGGHRASTVGGGNLHLVEEHLYLLHLLVVAGTIGQLVRGGVVAADNLGFGGLAAYLVVTDAETHHVHTHVGRRFVGVGAINAFEESIQHRENLNVAVVVHCHLAVGFEMERVDHVYIVQVGSGCLVGDVHRVL